MSDEVPFVRPSQEDDLGTWARMHTDESNKAHCSVLKDLNGVGNKVDTAQKQLDKLEDAFTRQQTERDTTIRVVRWLGAFAVSTITVLVAMVAWMKDHVNF